MASFVDMAVKPDMAVAVANDLASTDLAGQPDFAGLPPCDCTGVTDPLGSDNQCSLTSLCVGLNCCQEGVQFGICLPSNDCAPSATPQ
jgi:hypothetical protein